MELNGHMFSVRENLRAALCALRHFAHDPEAWTQKISGISQGDRLPVYFWVDAICINQNDIQERGHQVDMMRIIYPKARLVVTWLGPSTANSDSAFSFIKEDRGLDKPRAEDMNDDTAFESDREAL